MTSARAALTIARTMAAVARRDPSDDNLQAARAAIAAVAHRYDWRADQVGVSASGHGYNPYRAKGGQFGAGAHKERPKIGREHVAASQASPPRAALTKAKAAAGVARAKPTKENVAAAKRAVGEAAQMTGKTARVPKTKEQEIDRAFQHAAAGDHAKAQAIFAKHGVAVPDNVRKFGAHAGFDYNAAPTAKRTASAEKTEARRASEVSKFVARDQRRQLSAHDTTDSSEGKSGRQLTPESQAALRGHLNETLAKYGMKDRDAGLPEAHRVEVRHDDAMVGAAALHYTNTGKIALNDNTTSALYEHGKHDPTELGKRFQADDQEAQRMVGAYRVAAHEATHGHGPAVDYEKHGVMLEEMTTEMAARKVTADVHGLSMWDVRGVGSYHGYISPTVSALSDATGRSRQDAHDALAAAAIDFKRGGTGKMGISSEAALRKVGENALHHLGVHDENHTNAVHQAMLAASEDP